MTSAILDPTGTASRETKAGLELAARPDDLSAARIGLLENGKQNARLFLEDVADVLKERYGAGAATVRRKAIFSQPAPAELIEDLGSDVDVVVVGIGD